MSGRARRASNGATDRRRRLFILAICCMSLLIVGLDLTIVNVALPSIGRAFHAQVSGLQWTIDAYTVVLASLLILSGSTADRIGRRRVFVIGLSLFTGGSLLCSLAPNLDWLVAFRMLQAVGGSMLNPVALSIVRNTFSDSRERAQAFGFWGATAGISVALGPVVGGLLVQSVGWRSIFWINIPVGLLALALTLRFVPESKAPRPRRLDPVGQLLVIVALASLTFSIIQGPSAGWFSGEILATFAIALLAGAGLIAYELRRREALLELRFFRSLPFSSVNAIAVAAFASLAGFLFLNTLYLQEARHFSPLKAGLCLLPLAAMMFLCSLLAGRLAGRQHSRWALMAGGTGIALGALVLTGVSATTTLGLLFLAYVVFGIGLGMINAPITNTAVVGMPPEQAGVAAAIASTSRQVGATLGVAVIGATAASSVSGGVAKTFVSGTHTGWWIIFGFGIVIVLLAFAGTTARARKTAEETAARFDESAPRHQQERAGVRESPTGSRHETVSARDRGHA